jgi:repressor LexA
VSLVEHPSRQIAQKTREHQYSESGTQPAVRFEQREQLIHKHSYISRPTPRCQHNLRIVPKLTASTASQFPFVEHNTHCIKCCTKNQYAGYTHSTVQIIRNDMAPTNPSTQLLTARQAQILELIRRYINDTGYPPTRADIAAELGFKSANAAEEHLKALARKGAIEMIPGTSRGIRIPDLMDEGLPIVGRVAAGNPILAEENIEDRIDLPAGFFQPHADYLLRVRGDSMIDAGILDGDLLAVHKTEQATNGQIVVARIEEEVTVKRFQRTRKRNHVLLLPENSAYDPIEVDLAEQSFAIEGLSVGVIRQQI